MNDKKILLDSLIATLQGNTHMPLSDAVKDFPEEFINTHPPHVTYSFWHLLEHIRLTQIDILDYIRDPQYKEPKWPDDYWPKKDTNMSGWKNTIKMYNNDLKDIISFIENDSVDLFTRVNKGKGATIAHEILLISDHTSYHIGEFAILRQVMNIWPKNHKS